MSSTRLVHIPDRTFSGCTSLRSVTFPNSLKIIGEEAFRECSSLLCKAGSSNSLFGNRTIEEIGKSAFYGCSSFSELKLPASLRVVKACAFYGCKNLASVELPPKLQKIEKLAFWKKGQKRLIITFTSSRIDNKSREKASSNIHEGRAVDLQRYFPAQRDRQPTSTKREASSKRTAAADRKRKREEASSKRTAAADRRRKREEESSKRTTAADRKRKREISSGKKQTASARTAERSLSDKLRDKISAARNKGKEKVDALRAKLKERAVENKEMMKTIKALRLQNERMNAEILELNQFSERGEKVIDFIDDIPIMSMSCAVSPAQSSSRANLQAESAPSELPAPAATVTPSSSNLQMGSLHVAAIRDDMRNMMEKMSREIQGIRDELHERFNPNPSPNSNPNPNPRDPSRSSSHSPQIMGTDMVGPCSAMTMEHEKVGEGQSVDSIDSTTEMPGAETLGPWTPKELELLKNGMEILDRDDWHKLLDMVPTRGWPEIAGMITTITGEEGGLSSRCDETLNSSKSHSEAIQVEATALEQ